MENTVSKWRDLDDLIFEQRNKAYGAYTLRKAYGDNIRKATYVGLGIFLLVLFSPKIWASLKGNNPNFDSGMAVIIPPPPVETTKPVIPPPPPKPIIPPPSVATTRFVPPRVTNQEDIIEPDIPKMEEIKGSVSTETKEGINTVLPPVTEAAPPPPEPKEEKKVDDIDEVMTIVTVQQQPEFKNGLAAMYQFLSKNIVYPSVARENGIEGTVYVSFIVGKDGAIRDTKVIRGVGGGCSEEALRVIKLMPNWNPGKQNGKAVSVTFTMPVKFKLEN